MNLIHCAATSKGGRHLVCLILMVFFVGTLGVTAQQSAVAPTPQPTRAARPKIGVALSGGGARGFAHIGVLQWFEEHHIPVDYVAGTSMGGLVGGMYAMGMSPDEMREFAVKIDWEKMLSGPPSFDELSFRRKEDQRTYPTSIELGAKHGVHLPVGVNPGQYIGLLFDRMTLPYSTISSFDELPIPFRCVATDMLAAEPVVLKDGSLSQSLRATMSIPGLFTPVDMDGRVLADGGLLDNIPTDVVKDMGADIVIAVNIGTPLGTREDIQSLPGMLSQVIGVTTIESDRRNLRLANIVIAPKLGKFTLMNFTASKAIADLGYKGAEAEASALTPLSLDNGSWREYVAKRQSRKRSSVETPLALEIEGVKGRSSEDITRTLDSDLKSPIDSHKLDRQLNEIRGGGRYASLGYDVAMQEKEPRLRIRVAEKPFAPPMLIPVLLIQASGSSTVDLSAGFRLTNFDLGGYGSELRTDVLIGSNDLFALEYYHPFGKSGFFVAPRAYYSFQREDLYQSGDRLAEYNVKKVAAAADAGIIFNRKSQLRVGFEVGHEKADVSIGSPLLPNVSGAFIDASASYVWDGQDSAVIPTRGVRFSGVASWFFKSAGASQGFPQAVLSASWFKPLSEKSTLFAYGMGGTSFGKKPGPIQQFAIGGPFRLSAYGLGELRGNNVANGGVGYLRRVGYLPPFLGNKIYLGGWYEGGSAFSNSTLRGYANDVAGAAVVETFMGPVTIGGSLGEGGRGRVFFSLGRLF